MRRFIPPLAIAASCVFVLSACGGGGGGNGNSSGSSSSSSSSATTQSVEGLWSGTATDTGSGTSFNAYGVITSAGQTLLAISSNGAYFGLASGLLSVAASTVTSTDFVTLGLGTGAATAGTLSGGVTSRFSIIAKATYPNNVNDNYNLSYDKQYETAASVATAKGTYTVRNSLGVATGSFSVDDNGVLSGTNDSCPFSGTLKPHGDGSRNVHDITVNATAGTSCTTQLANLSGLATLAALSGTDTTKSLLLMATRQSGSVYSVFVAAGRRN
ncbi:MAG: hypothetical protein QM803_00300 [Rhodocyclaceae bacterium]